jgi:SAM-dependent methyltransferase
VTDGDLAFDAAHLLDVMDAAENYNRQLLDEVLAYAGNARSVLDFGAGHGRLLRGLAAHGLRGTGVEPDPALRQRLSASGIEAVANLEALGTRQFPLVVSMNVLEHVDDDDAALRALWTHTEPGGRMLLYLPALQALWTANDDRVGHRRRYGRRDLAARCTHAGFAVEEVRFVDSLGALAALAYRVVGDGSGELSVSSVGFYDRFVFPASRALDRVLHRVVGKNLLLRARRP